jgi:hypothetical protein
MRTKSPHGAIAQGCTVMKQSDFEGILSGLKEVETYAKGEADASTYRVHVPQEIDMRTSLGSLAADQRQ